MEPNCEISLKSFSFEKMEVNTVSRVEYFFWAWSTDTPTLLASIKYVFPLFWIFLGKITI